MKLAPDTARRLASYSAAAGLGAFAFGQSAEADIIFTDVDPDLESVAGEDAIQINLDNAGYAEAAVLNVDVANNNFDSIRVKSTYGGTVLTTHASGYYVQAFDEGALIGPSSIVASGGQNTAARGNGYNFIDTGKYVGVKFDIGGATHYGWVRMDIDSTSPMHGTVYSYAYESTPDTAIAAGAMPVPEPTSLALLAAGAGSLALRRRRAD